MKNRSGIYLILCTATNHRYVGSSGHLASRWKEHRYKLRHALHGNMKLTAEWEIHGENAFVFSVLEIVDDPALLFEREQYWLDLLHPELNIAVDAKRPAYGVPKTDETKSRIKAAQVKRHARMTPARKQSTIENIKSGMKEWWNSLSDTERQEHLSKTSNPHTDATKKALSIRAKGRPGYWTGKRRPPETIEKLKAAQQARYAKTHVEREAKKQAVRAQFEAGRDDREQERRRKIAAAHTGRAIPEETKEKLRQAALAQQQDPAYRERHQAGLVEAMQRPEVLQHLSDSHKGKHLSAEHRQAIGDATRGRVRSEETRHKQAEAMKRKWAERKRRKEELQE